MAGEVAEDDDEIIVPRKLKAKPVSTGRSASAPMRKLMRLTTALGILFGGAVALIGVMAVVGLVVANLGVRVGIALLVVIGLPAFLSDRLLKRTRANLGTRGSLGMVTDVFAIVLLGVALTFVAADAVTKRVLSHEGDLHAKAGAQTVARIVYFVAGVSPTFPGDKGDKSASPAASSASSAEPRSSK